MSLLSQFYNCDGDAAGGGGGDGYEMGGYSIPVDGNIPRNDETLKFFADGLSNGAFTATVTDGAGYNQDAAFSLYAQGVRFPKYPVTTVMSSGISCMPLMEEKLGSGRKHALSAKHWRGNVQQRTGQIVSTDDSELYMEFYHLQSYSGWWILAATKCLKQVTFKFANGGLQGCNMTTVLGMLDQAFRDMPVNSDTGKVRTLRLDTGGAIALTDFSAEAQAKINEAFSIQTFS